MEKFNVRIEETPISKRKAVVLIHTRRLVLSFLMGNGSGKVVKKFNPYMGPYPNAYVLNSDFFPSYEEFKKNTTVFLDDFENGKVYTVSQILDISVSYEPITVKMIKKPDWYFDSYYEYVGIVGEDTK